MGLRGWGPVPVASLEGIGAGAGAGTEAPGSSTGRPVVLGAPPAPPVTAPAAGGAARPDAWLGLARLGSAGVGSARLSSARSGSVRPGLPRLATCSEEPGAPLLKAPSCPAPQCRAVPYRAVSRGSAGFRFPFPLNGNLAPSHFSCSLALLLPAHEPSAQSRFTETTSCPGVAAAPPLEVGALPAPKDPLM